MIDHHDESVPLPRDTPYIPEHLREGVVEYIEHGHLPGDFLCAVLENDLAQAVGRADEISLRFLPNLVCYLYNLAPKGAWGSRERVLNWSTKKLAGENSAG